MGNQSNDYSENEKDTDDEENSSTTEEAVSKPNLSDTDEERSSDNDKMNTTYQNSETLKIDTQELQKSESTVHHNLDDSVDKIVDLQTNQQEHDVKLTKKEKSIHDGGDHPVLENDSPEIEEELYNSDSIDHKYNCKSSPKYYDKMENCSELINETPLLSQIQHNVIKDEICNDTSKRLQLSSSGDESDIEDDVTTQEDIDSPVKLALPSKKRRLEDIHNLPETCTLLRTKNGARVYVVGTAHFSHESQVDVATVIQTVQPDIVVLELCKERTNILHLDEETVLEEAKNLTMDKMILAIRQNGTIQGVMYLLLLSMSAHLTKELGMAPGGEFRRAFREAHSVPGCLVHLGDRPINVTLKRALGSLSLWQKLKLGINILTSKDTITKEDVEKCKQKDLLESMLEEMAGEFPALSRVFVQERDLYLAHSLKLAANRPFGHRSPSNSAAQQFEHEEPVVVGVVGIGHVPGIVQNWETVQPEDVAKVVFIPPMSTSEKMTRIAIRITFTGLTLYTGYRLFKTPILKSVSAIERVIYR